MKINNCKLCEIYDNQKLSSSDKGSSNINAQPHFCRHTSAAASLFSPTNFRDVALAFHLLRGYYQPAGPLISQHILPPQQIPPPLESDQTQSPQSSASTADNGDPDVMITGGDLAPRPPPPYRYGPHPSDYSRPPMHQMHYQTYPPSPYGYYSQPPPPPQHQELCYQPYYAPKYYAPNSSPYARRYMPPNYYQNASQIVPTAPNTQHMDPYYTGYGPSGGGQCYNQNPPMNPSRNMQPPSYLDTPQYHHNASCPCPMQSCPKNALTGTGPIKGPVSANISNALVDNIPSINNNNTTSNNISCKIENILTPNVVIKPETSVDDNSSTHTKPHETYENLQHLHPAYSMSNHKMLEPPELTLSPARGSTGLQIPPTVQHEAVQPTENNLNASDNNVSLSQRKQPRVGKSMERERQQMAMTGYQTTLDNAIALEVSHFKQEFEVKKEGSIVKKEKDCDDNDTITERYQSNNTLTKSIENVKLERPETQLEPIQVPPKQTENDMIDRNTINLINESGDECLDYSISKRRLNDSDDVIELSDNSTLDPPVSTLKRRKLLEIPISTPKKSPPNSYKSLIKRNNPSSPTHTNSTSKSKLISTNFNRINNKLCVKRRSIFKNKMSIKKFRLAAKAKRKALKKKISQEDTQNRDNEENATTAMKTNEIENVLDTNENDQSKSTDIVENVTSPQVQSEHIEDKSMDGSSEYSGKSNIDVTIDRVAKGYFSESEIFSCLSKHRKTKSQKKFDARLLKAGVAGKKKYNKADVVVDSVPTVTKTKKKGKAKKGLESVAIAIVKQTKTKKFNTKESTNDLAKNSKKKPKDEKRLKDDLIIETDPLAIDNTPASHSTPKRKHPKQSRTIEKKSNKKCKVNEPIEIVIEPSKPESEENEKTITTKDETISSVSSSTETVKCSKPLLDETDVANNNDECFEDNNTRQKHQESLTLYKTPGYGWTTLHKSSGKRGKKSKFSNRKKHKLTLLNEIVIPKSTSIPRWSNGWVWEGEPYQALVFLNSDDPPVYRTCYDSMRHEECGDIIRPRDCVLLRAGGKRNELPYVAKVAQLWENPEDGEMMMSLFWYYRPEHTEQGRQDMDASDEVFASRHKDHNSVACIEDKCHVLSYSEYCRYRKTLRSIEENIEEHQSLVPKMHESDRRAVPLSTSPELVMFCRRIYDFRGKRLVEDKKKK